MYDQLNDNEDALWSLLTVSGYPEVVRSGGYQISENGYAQLLLDRGIPRERIRWYGFTFEGKNVLIG